MYILITTYYSSYIEGSYANVCALLMRQNNVEHNSFRFSLKKLLALCTRAHGWISFNVRNWRGTA